MLEINCNECLAGRQLWTATGIETDKKEYFENELIIKARFLTNVFLTTN
jgi:hypothetical protein